MNVKEGFMSGFLILGFAVFIVGFLTGMLTIALIPVKPDFQTLGFTIFIFGFISGMTAIALVLAIVKLKRINKEVLARTEV